RTPTRESASRRGLGGGGAALLKPTVRGGRGDRCARSVWPLRLGWALPFRCRRSPAQRFRLGWSGVWRGIARAVATSEETHARFAWVLANRCVPCMSWGLLTVRASAFASCASALELTAG